MVARLADLFEAPLGHFETVSAQGFVPVAVENPGGSIRRGKGAGGQ